MNSSAEAPAFVAKVKPRRSLVRNGMLSYVFLSLPLFGALYFFSSSSMVWITVLAIHLLSLALAAVLYVRYTMVFIGVTPTAIHERSFLGGERVMLLSTVGDSVLANTYRSSSTETMPQLLVRCVDNKRALRMRGMFWTDSDIRLVATTIAGATGLPLDERKEPITSSVFFEEYPGSAYWFENRPYLVVVAGFITMLAVLGLVFGLMAVMNIPFEQV